MKNSEKIIQKEQKTYDPICNSPTQDNTSASAEKDECEKKKNMISMINKQNPEFLENFEIMEYLNSGSAGEVYRGIYKGNIERQVALKFVMKEKQKEKNERHNQEVAIERRLHNKNVTEIYAYFKKEGYDISVLEYAKHGDFEHFLKDLLKRPILSETSLNYFGKGILDGLHYIHKNKVVHMDIKPGNILIDSNLDVKITDFSVSCQYNTFHPDDLVKYPFAGTGKFIPPEIISKTHMKIKDAEKIDMYSFGVTLYYLFYGKYPYKLNEVKGKDYDAILKYIKNEELEFPKERKMSNLFKDFLSKALDKNYLKRMSIREALEHPWIQGSKYIFDEKENTYLQENFLIKLITDSRPKFNEYIK